MSPCPGLCSWVYLSVLLSSFSPFLPPFSLPPSLPPFPSFSFYFFLFFDRVLLFSPGWSWTNNPSVSAFQVVDYRSATTIPRKFVLNTLYKWDYAELVFFGTGFFHLVQILSSFIHMVSHWMSSFFFVDSE
jgi:hypothetical protein